MMPTPAVRSISTFSSADSPALMTIAHTGRGLGYLWVDDFTDHVDQIGFGSLFETLQVIAEFAVIDRIATNAKT